MGNKPIKTKPSTRQQIDFEEIAPDQFVVRHPQLRGLLKDEGNLRGMLFELTTWRRDGLIARLRSRSYRVLTLADAIAALPTLPHPPESGGDRWYPVGTNDLISWFDPHQLDWQPLNAHDHQGKRGTWIAVGQVVRRRQGRGPARYAVVLRSGELAARDESAALLLGYALAVPYTLVAPASDQPNTWQLPPIALPPPHRDLMHKIAVEHNSAFVIDDRSWELAVALVDRLGGTLTRAR